MVIYGVVAGITATAALIWSKYPVRWILALLTVGLILAVFWIDVPQIDDRLPAAFRGPVYFRLWVLILSLLAIYTLTHLVGTLIRSRRGRVAEDSAAAPGFPDLDAAWDEILMRLGQASYDVEHQHLYLLLPPEELLAAEMINASEMSLFTSAPTAPEAPIHAYATTDGLFLSCAGASAWGRQDAEGTTRLEDLCRKLLALNPEQPTLRGVAVLFPIEKATSGEALKRVGSVRNDLQTIWSRLNLRCPTLAVLCLHESRSGFNEFARRMPSGLRHNRCGFSVPLTLPFNTGTVQQGLNWFAQWFQSWSLSLMVQDYVNKEGNGKLVEMNAQMRRDLPAIRDLIESSFSTHVRAEPTLVRGCYFVACGPEPENHAFVAGLVRGPKSKMIADSVWTAWSRGAENIERRYRLVCLCLGLFAAAIALPIWFIGIKHRLASDRVGLAWLFWAGLAFLTVVWLSGLLYPWLSGQMTRKAAS
jgi:type VI secretion system protein ImpL